MWHTNIYQSVVSKQSWSASDDPSGHTCICLWTGLATLTSGLYAGISMTVMWPEAPFTLQATLSDKARQSHSFQWRAGDFRRHERQRPLVTGWGVSSNATKFRILKIYANEERLSGATANRKEDGWAHMIVLLSAVDKHTQWKKSRLCFSFIFVCMSVFNLYLYHI